MERDNQALLIGAAAAVAAVAFVALRKTAGQSMATEKYPGILSSLSGRAAAAAAELSRRAEIEGLPVTFTSGRRGALEQAGLMLRKLQRGEDLMRLYGGSPIVAELLAGPIDTARWAEILAQSPPVSKHQTGDAIDVRTAGLTSGQIYRLGELAIFAGFGRALRESDHLHLQL